jgi:hypothetical protein
MSLKVITSTFGLALALGAARLTVDGLGWRVVALCCSDCHPKTNPQTLPARDESAAVVPMKALHPNTIRELGGNSCVSTGRSLCDSEALLESEL